MSTDSHAYSGLDKPDTSNATWFNSNEASASRCWNTDECWLGDSAFRYQEKQKMWKYLGSLNDGVRNGKWTHSPYQTYIDNSHLIETVSCQMDLPKIYWSQAREYYFSLHQNVIRNVRKDSTAVAVVAYVIHTNQENRPFHPNTKLNDSQTVAEHLAEKFCIPVKTIHKRFGQVMNNIEKLDTTSEPIEFDKRGVSLRGLSENGDEM